MGRIQGNEDGDVVGAGHFHQFSSIRSKSSPRMRRARRIARMWSVSMFRRPEPERWRQVVAQCPRSLHPPAGGGGRGARVVASQSPVVRCQRFSHRGRHRRQGGQRHRLHLIHDCVQALDAVVEFLQWVQVAGRRPAGAPRRLRTAHTDRRALPPASRSPWLSLLSPLPASLRNTSSEV